MAKKTIFILALILIFGCASPSSRSVLKRYVKSDSFFGGTVKVDVCYEPSQQPQLRQAIDEIWRRFADIHWRLSVYDPKSDLNKINQSYPDAVTVGQDTYQLIKDSIYYNRLSRGVFDITIYPLVRLWKQSEKKDALPTPGELQQAQQSIGVHFIELLPNNQVRRLNPGTQLDIDSIADGYAADEAARILRAYGFQNFLVDATGDLFAGGNNCQGRAWRIGVQDPANAARVVDVVEISNAAVSTAGGYEHFYTIQGKRWSHIINPLTGYPASDIGSATAIAPSAQFSAFWTKTLSLLSAEEGVALTDALGEGYASMVIVDTGQGKPTMKHSRNYARYSHP